MRGKPCECIAKLRLAQRRAYLRRRTNTTTSRSARTTCP